ncbi:dihydrolipoyllysine-residue acetyltransferase [Ferribacterium limneticum]|uniref:dihydrolipoyllysine-residue acetyltransferase n=1 Tax=Ferribacterium limneticum TaxID=76259 RepID=UPI001CFB81C2|nr:dihydrolipoyllysine-residue acetyltransferase [Ferribacterium limneticum]UCV28983.1 dihydrolipoyllysine-residue acetyltransferase [Ferribacterium limneticum]UCV32901.1 dihydrolipoyllysine-residue acetyltransferase [Ferribacterium limneticum]
MSQIIEVKVPDIGDFAEVPVIELYVKVGDSIKIDDAIATLESDKATMDVPSTVEGVVKEVLVQLGSKVGEGSVLIKVESGGAAVAAPAAAPAAQAAAPAPAPAAAPVAAAPAAGGGVVEVKVPDIGDFAEVPVIELYVKVGDSIKVDDAIATLESDKATMDVPSTVAGTVKEVLVQLGSKVGEGTVLIKVETGASAPAAALQSAAPAPAAAAPVAAPAAAPVAAAPAALAPALAAGAKVHASPSVRAYARELGVDLNKVPATGPKNRIVKEDLTKYVKGVMSGAVAGPAAAAAGASLGGGLDLLPWPKVDFAKFGEIEVKPLSRIKKISGQNLSRNWVMIPAVTYHEDADITDIEAFRVLLNKENEKGGGAKLTMLAFLMKACVKGLQKFPEFNSSLDGDNLVMKKYFNIGFAADTPNGLVVPVVKNVDKKSVFELAQESGDLAKQARDGKLKPADMSGACFTISSLGGIGGTYFAPIVNAPEVAILGVNKSAMKPVWDGKQFVPRLVLPLSLTADHRVIDGALATRFNVYIAQLLADFRRVAL